MILIPLDHLLILSGLLFTIGLIGVITRRNILLILLNLEILLSAANLAFVSFAYAWKELSGQIMVFFIFIVAAVEITVGLAIALLLVRHAGKMEADEIRQMKW